jgi:hypothetical protein
MILGYVVNPFLTWKILLKTNANLKEDLKEFEEAFEKCHACMHGLIHDGQLRACPSCLLGLMYVCR